METTIAKGFKIVTNELDALFSAIVHLEIGSVEYKPNEWIHPNQGCGPLAVFNTMENLMKFVSFFYGLIEPSEIWECEYEPSEKKRMYMNDKYERYLTLGNAPEGTVLADKVKLTKKVRDIVW